MIRRQFIQNSAACMAALGTAGCSSLFRREIKLKIDRDLRRDPEKVLKITRSKPAGGTMPMGEIGKTGIRVSKFGFGSHMSQDLLPYEKEREFMVREACDLGINIFDIYEKSWNVYQYEPMGLYLAPIINDVVLSIDIVPYDGRTVVQELERALRLFHRDYIDMVRLHARSLDDSLWKEWDTLFKLKQQGKIRAVGVAIHFVSEVEIVIPRVSVDYVIFPYNFYHNIIWDGRRGQNFDPLVSSLRQKGIGIITMKPFGTDSFVNSLISAAAKLDKSHAISLPQAALRYIRHSGLNPDTTLGGMYSTDHIYEDVIAFYNQTMSPEEQALLEKLRDVARVYANVWLPDHYRFLNSWAPELPHAEYQQT